MNKPVKIQGGTMTWLMEDAISPGIGVSMAEMIVDPGETSELHLHSNCAEIIHVIEGQIDQRIGEDWIPLKAGGSCVIPADQAHQTRNIGTIPARLILVYTAGERVYRKL